MLALMSLQNQLDSGQKPKASTLRLAIAEVSKLETAWDTSHAVEHAIPHALVVEANGPHGQVLSNHLRRAGYHVTACNSANDGLAFLAPNQLPNVIQLDLNTPDVSNYSLSEAIRNRALENAIPLYCISASRPDPAWLQGGVSRWFRKPVHPQDLINRLNRDLVA